MFFSHLSIASAPFRIAFQEAGALGTMCSHNDYNGMPVSASRYLLTDLIRKQWGFKGNVRTMFKDPSLFIETLRNALSQGLISQETLDRRVREVLYVKFWLGLFDTPYGNAEEADRTVDSQEHRNTALEAARESIVLLKNQNSLLPLSKGIKNVAVIGPLANNASALRCRYGALNQRLVTGLEGIKNYLGKDANVLYAKGCDVRDKNFPQSDVMYFPLSKQEQAAIDEAVEIARKSEVAILFVGDDSRTIGESRSRVLVFRMRGTR